MTIKTSGLELVVVQVRLELEGRWFWWDWRLFWWDYSWFWWDCHCSCGPWNWNCTLVLAGLALVLRYW